MKAMLRDRLYVVMLNMAVRVATENTREIHHEIHCRGLIAYSESLDARIHKGFESPPPRPTTATPAS